MKISGTIIQAVDDPHPVRVIQVNRQALALFNRIGLKPPDVGQFKPKDLDRQLDDAGLSTAERMQCKAHLRDAGLLSTGRILDGEKL
jgi:hypothetical protein